MALKAGTLAVIFTGGNKLRFPDDGQHVLIKDRHHGSVLIRIPGLAEARVQVGSVPFCKNSGIELLLISLLIAKIYPILIMNIA